MSFLFLLSFPSSLLLLETKRAQVAHSFYPRHGALRVCASRGVFFGVVFYVLTLVMIRGPYSFVPTFVQKPCTTTLHRRFSMSYYTRKSTYNILHAEIWGGKGEGSGKNKLIFISAPINQSSVNQRRGATYCLYTSICTKPTASLCLAHHLLHFPLPISAG